MERYPDTCDVVSFDEDDARSVKVMEGDMFTRYKCANDGRKLTKVSCPDSLRYKGYRYIHQQLPTLFCVCKQPYNPDAERMRFCRKCKAFYHERCLNRSDTNEKASPEIFIKSLLFGEEGGEEYATRKLRKADFAGVEPFVKEIAQSPAIRGKEFGPAGNIEAVGRARAMIWRKVTGLADMPFNWERELIPGRTRTPSRPVTERSRVLYRCPVCESQV